MAKPIPEKAPDVEEKSVHIPTSLPSALTKAPPELPGLIEASV